MGRETVAGWMAALALLAALTGSIFAQELGTMAPQPLPPLADPNDPSVPAKQLFGRAVTPADLQARSIGFYAHGCLAGAEALPVNGPAWQVMRLSRNRNWGHPALIALLERFAKQVPSINGWPGLLVGDVSQPRGGVLVASAPWRPRIQALVQRAGAWPDAFRPCRREPSQTSAKRSEPMPLLHGSTIAMTAAVAIAASTALPPRCRIERPACAASGCDGETTLRPNTGWRVLE